MARWIQNADILASTPLRAVAVDILEAGYDSIDTEQVIAANVRVDEGVISIRDQQFRSEDFENIYLMGFGKGSCAAVTSLYRVLQTHLKKSVVIDRSILSTCPVEVDAYLGTHPMPSETNVDATRVILGIAQEAGERDLVIVVVAGGGSALLCSSVEECDQNGRLFELAERTGVTIQEMNLVRRHISTLKGGGLARELYPATVVGLIFSDIVGGNPQDVASGPTFYDVSTIEDARAALQRLGAADEFTLIETPKEKKFFERVTNHVLVSNEDSLRAMAKKAESLGYRAVVMEQPVYDFADEVVAQMTSHAEPRSVVLAGGEIRIKVPEDHGVGGRCQYFAVRSLGALDAHRVCVGASSDGRDNCDAAGAIVDAGTRARATEHGIDIASHERRADTFPLFQQTGDLIITGQTQANVSDWYMVITE